MAKNRKGVIIEAKVRYMEYDECNLKKFSGRNSLKRGKPILKQLFDISEADDIAGYNDRHVYVVALFRRLSLSDSQLLQFLLPLPFSLFSAEVPILLLALFTDVCSFL